MRLTVMRQLPSRQFGKFGVYLGANQALIPDCGDHYRNKEAITTAFVESAVNHLVSK